MEKTQTVALKSPLHDWPIWWNKLSTLQKFLPITLALIYWGTLIRLHGLRVDHLLMAGALLFFSYAGRTAHQIRAFALPFILTGIIYDSQRFYSDYLRGPIHVTEPYHFDKYFFGINTAQGILTPNEYWQLHTHPVLDLLCGFAYLTFISVFVIQSGWLYFGLSRRGTELLKGMQIRKKAEQMIWTFFWVNIVGYSTYYWYAASPPWYVALYGLGPARHVPANQAGCIRFDQLLGTHFFTEMYGRSADVHGAIPSLHVAYPFIAMLFAFQVKRLRVFSVFFYLLMCFSAVYLNHHYILDILWGSGYALLTTFFIGWLAKNEA
ncbi:phosphatase PAP2 family protein [Bdellovibrionota bacterium FG-1]